MTDIPLASMRILYIAHRIPYPPNKGEKIRSFHQIKYLARRHEVHLACLVDDPGDLRFQYELRSFCRSVHAVPISRYWAYWRALLSLASRQPLTLPFFYSARLKRSIARMTESLAFDLIYVFSSSMAQYVSDSACVPTVLDMVDVDSDKWRQYARFTRWPRSALYALEWRRLAAYECSIMKRFRQTLVIAEPEAKILRALNPSSAITVIANGADVADGDPPAGGSVSADLRRAAPYVVFTGAMDYFPNIDGVRYFINEVWPQVRRAVPDLRFYVVGMNPTRAIRALAKRDLNVVVTGYVPDTRPYLAHAAACVIPLRIARGIQNKILEAAAAGTPVITTPQALEGLCFEPGREVRLADTAATFAEEVVRVVQSPEQYRQQIAAAIEAVKTHYSWEASLLQLDTLLCAVADTYRNQPHKSAAQAI